MYVQRLYPIPDYARRGHNDAILANPPDDPEYEMGLNRATTDDEKYSTADTPMPTVLSPEYAVIMQYGTSSHEGMIVQLPVTPPVAVRCCPYSPINGIVQPLPVSYWSPLFKFPCQWHGLCGSVTISVFTVKFLTTASVAFT